MLTIRSGVIASSLSVLVQVTRRLVGIVSLVILARILTPEDYGLVAIALIFLNFIDVVSNTGGNSYLLSRDTLTQDTVFTDWTLNLILKGSLALLLSLASYPIALFYDDMRLLPILLVFSIQIVTGLLVSPGLIFKIKQQQLAALSTWQIISRVMTAFITIGIAVMYKTYWALVIGQFLVTLSQVIASYVIAPMRPRLSLKQLKPQWDFSKWVLPQSVLNFFRSQIDTIFVSTAFDKATIGAYNSMRYYANIPTTMLINPASGPLLTQFSEFKNNPAYFEKQLQVVMCVMSLITAPIIYLMFVHGHYLVDLILGEKWVKYADFFIIFAFLTIVMTLNNLLSQIVMLKDKTRLLFGYSVVSTLLQFAMFLLVDFSDVYQLAEYKVMLDVISVCLFYVVVICLCVGRQSLVPLALPVIPATLLIYGCGWLAFQVVPDVSSFWSLFFHCSITLGLFSAAQLLLMLLLKQVYCYGYILKLMQPLGRKCIEKLF